MVYSDKRPNTPMPREAEWTTAAPVSAEKPPASDIGPLLPIATTAGVASGSGSDPNSPPALVSGRPQSCTATWTDPSPASSVTSISPRSSSGYAFSSAKLTSCSTTAPSRRSSSAWILTAAANAGISASTRDGALASLRTVTFTLDTATGDGRRRFRAPSPAARLQAPPAQLSGQLALRYGHPRSGSKTTNQGTTERRARTARAQPRAHA